MLTHAPTHILAYIPTYIHKWINGSKILKRRALMYIHMKFQELFEVTYNGNVAELTESIEHLEGIQNAKTSEPNHRSVDKTLEYTITYNPEETDRTMISNCVEEFSNVSGTVKHA